SPSAASSTVCSVRLAQSSVSLIGASYPSEPDLSAVDSVGAVCYLARLAPAAHSGRPEATFCSLAACRRAPGESG
ncbi:MAG TPA: hypothetical protein VIO94_02220, partial [Phenylobacterium sp.]